MSLVTNTIASPEVIPEKTVNKCRITQINLDCRGDVCQFEYVKGYMDGAEFVQTWQGSGSIRNGEAGNDFETYICINADPAKTICENVEAGVWAYLVAKNLV